MQRRAVRSSEIHCSTASFAQKLSSRQNGAANYADSSPSVTFAFVGSFSAVCCALLCLKAVLLCPAIFDVDCMLSVCPTSAACPRALLLAPLCLSARSLARRRPIRRGKAVNSFLRSKRTLSVELHAAYPSVCIHLLPVCFTLRFFGLRDTAVRSCSRSSTFLLTIILTLNTRRSLSSKVVDIRPTRHLWNSPLLHRRCCSVSLKQDLTLFWIPLCITRTDYFLPREATPFLISSYINSSWPYQSRRARTCLHTSSLIYAASIRKIRLTKGH